MSRIVVEEGEHVSQWRNGYAATVAHAEWLAEEAGIRARRANDSGRRAALHAKEVCDELTLETANPERLAEARRLVQRAERLLKIAGHRLDEWQRTLNFATRCREIAEPFLGGLN